MKLLRKDLKQGVVRLLVDSPEDLWYLSQVIDPHDRVVGRTTRKLRASEEGEAVRRPVVLGVDVEKVEFGGDVLRVTGKIVESPPDVPRGNYHTISVVKGDSISIFKRRWLGFQLDRLNEAVEANVPGVLIVVFDREEAFFALLKRTGSEILGRLKGDVARKVEGHKSKGGFYEEIVAKIRQYDDRFSLDVVVLASPAFWREEVFRRLKDPVLKKKVVRVSCSAVNERVVDEVVKSDVVRSSLKAVRASRELVLVDRLLSEIAKGGRFAYGLQHVGRAVDAGSVEILLVTDSAIRRFREEQKFDVLDRIMRGVERHRGEIVLVSSEHEGGKKLDGLGGVAALLRYRLSYD